jgi:flagellar hook-length control protein FliK
VSFPTAPPKAARSDPSPGTDSFGALVDSSAHSDTGNDRTASAAQQQYAPQRRAGDAAASNDNTQSRDAAPVDQSTRNNSDDRDAAARQVSDRNADANRDAVQRSQAKSRALKAGIAKSAEKPASDKTSDSSEVPAATTPQGDPPATTSNAVAVAIPVTIASADVPAATPASGDAAAPLAIAAAAMTAGSPVAAAPAVSIAQIKIDSDVAATADTASEAAIADTAAAAATAKVAIGAAASEAVTTPVKPIQTDAPAATDAALTAAVALTSPVTSKSALPKFPVASQAKAASSGSSDSATSEPPANATPIEAARSNLAQQPAAAAKREAGNNIVDMAKTDASANSSSATVAAHDHSTITGTGHAPTESSDAGFQATGIFQAQLPPTTATVSATGPLSVTAATNAPVPLSGLALEIAVSARSGKSRFEIRLDPADLGRIDVRVDVDRNGQVTSHLTVEKPETLSMLRQDAPQLQRALDDAGLKTGTGGLQFSLRDQSSSGQNGGNEAGRDAQRLVINDEEISAAVAGRTYGRMLGSGSGVDIRV